jgi:ATP-dependent Clp protease ATP-binding subunit ClpB
MTSNIGSQFILELAGDDSRYDEMQKQVMELLGQNFRPEFLNRIDDTIIFHSLQKSQLRGIIQIQIQRLIDRLVERKVGLKLTDEALGHIVEVGYDPLYGARPLKRAIQRELETPIAKGILRGDFKEGETISVALVEDRLIFATQTPQAPAEVVAEISPTK